MILVPKLQHHLSQDPKLVAAHTHTPSLGELRHLFLSLAGQPWQHLENPQWTRGEDLKFLLWAGLVWLASF